MGVQYGRLLMTRNSVQGRGLTATSPTHPMAPRVGRRRPSVRLAECCGPSDAARKANCQEHPLINPTGSSSALPLQQFCVMILTRRYIVMIMKHSGKLTPNSRYEAYTMLTAEPALQMGRWQAVTIWHRHTEMKMPIRYPLTWRSLASDGSSRGSGNETGEDRHQPDSRKLLKLQTTLSKRCAGQACSLLNST